MIYNSVELHNVAEVVPAGDGMGVRLSRVPEPVRQALNVSAQSTAFNTCGCEIRFNLHGDAATVSLQRPPFDGGQAQGVVEVHHGAFQDGYPRSPQFVGIAPSEIRVTRPGNPDLLAHLTQEQGLPFAADLVRVILPYDLNCRLMDITGDVSPPTPGQAPALRYLAYGSSITHGGNANHPTGTYAMRLAQRLGADLINLGFAGSAHLEPEMADHIAARTDWQIATLELGINVLGQWPVERFAERAAYFIAHIAGSDPGRWVFCTDVFTSRWDFTEYARLAEYREAIRMIVARHDLPRLIYNSGRDLLSSVTGLTVDLVHPSAAGMEEIARAWAAVIESKAFRRADR